MNENKRKVVFMTGAGGGMGSESFKQMLPDVGKLYDLVYLTGTRAGTMTCLTGIKEQKDLRWFMGIS